MSFGAKLLAGALGFGGLFWITFAVVLAWLGWRDGERDWKVYALIAIWPLAFMGRWLVDWICLLWPGFSIWFANLFTRDES
jgi:hypothetical protein